MNLIDPFSTIPLVGLCAVVPAGIVIAEVVFTLATLPVDGLNKISFPEVVEISLSVIMILSLTLIESVVFNTPAVVIFPVDASMVILVVMII